jgi:hypothetical protein
LGLRHVFQFGGSGLPLLNILALCHARDSVRSHCAIQKQWWLLDNQMMATLCGGQINEHILYSAFMPATTHLFIVALRTPLSSLAA